MKRGVAPLVALAIGASATNSALACTPIRYDTEGLTAATVAERLVVDSARIELMRVTARHEVNADPLYAEYYGQVYEFRLETVEVIDGQRGPPLALYGLNPDWLAHRLPNFPHITREPLWWLTSAGYGEMQGSRLLDPSDQGSIACENPLTFAVGETYLVFRDGSGAVVGPAFSGSNRLSLERPVIERIYRRDDPWLREVRRAVEANPQPSPSLLTYLFQAVFGPRRVAVDQRGDSRP